MSLHHLGETRGRRTHDHLLQTPDTFVWAPLPGMKNATACVHCAPALGAGFAMYTAAFEAGGSLGPAVGSRFIFVLDGSVRLRTEDKEVDLSAGSFAYLPEAHFHDVTNIEANATAVVIEKRYVAAVGVTQPDVLISSEQDIVPVPLLGDEAVQVRSLLPDDPAFDFAVNTMEYRPGASLSMVESHVMEHGLLMLEGEGIYRLGEAWYPVAKGHFIWMGAFCPQWFGALGKIPAKYLIYKDWNRHPLGAVASR